ncbi:hypothetical protein SESBI_34946 [Sesbania bispinosa]|nr:hypothetical protein SESBI_34946 [Sesbania bispinosa]
MISYRGCSTHVTCEAESHGGCMKSSRMEVLNVDTPTLPLNHANNLNFSKWVSQNLVKVFTISLFVATMVVLFFLRSADNPTALLCFENQARDLEKIKFPCVDWNSIAPISDKTSEVHRSGGVNHRLGFRKNVGYLFAIQYGANKIFDVDDKGDVVAGDLGKHFDAGLNGEGARKEQEVILQYSRDNPNRIVFNPYVHFG